MITILCSNDVIKKQKKVCSYPILKDIDSSVYDSCSLQKCLDEFAIQFENIPISLYNKNKEFDIQINNLIAYYEPAWTQEFKHLGVDLFEGEFILKHIPGDLIELARMGKLRIILSTILEPFAWSGFDFKTNYEDKIIIPNTHKIAKKLRIPGKQIIILTGDLNAEKKWQKYIECHNIVDPIRVKSYLYWGSYYKSAQISNVSQSLLIEPIKRNITKTFISFNRHLREHRVLLIELLYRYNLLNDGFVSCPKQIAAESFCGIASNIYKKYKTHLPVRDGEFMKRCNNLKENVLPLTLDVKDIEKDNPIYPSSIDRTIHYYNRSFCSIIAETAFDGLDAIFLSEKIFKPIILKHPFLLVGQQYSLKTFHNYGFKTFSPIIDESYDSIEHWIDRTTAVVNEVKRLSSLPKKTLHCILLSLKENFNYNYSWYYDGFQDKIKRILFEILEN